MNLSASCLAGLLDRLSQVSPHQEVRAIRVQVDPRIKCLVPNAASPAAESGKVREITNQNDSRAIPVGDSISPVKWRQP